MSRLTSLACAFVLKMVVFISAIILGTASASAHAHLSGAEPRVDSTVASSPEEVKLLFTEDLEPAFSAIEVQNADGKRMDEGKAEINGRMMRIGVKPLSAGTYKVFWRALSVDTHKSDGNFTFRVGN